LAGNSCHDSAGNLPGRHGVQLRRLGDEDLARIELHLLSLDMPSRNSRFHSGFGDAAVAAYVRGLDPGSDVLFGAVDAGTGRIVGLAEARPANAPKTVDLAASVLPSHRKRGLAHALVTRAVGVASAQGATAADLRFAPDNLAANRIAARLGARFRAPGLAVAQLQPCDPVASGAARSTPEWGSA
jgi:GNAT superfamily N-acetyltransferase